MRKILITAVALSLVTFHANAWESVVATGLRAMAAGAKNNCKMVENVTVKASFTVNANSLTEAKSAFDAQSNKVNALVAELKLGKLEPTRSNFNINRGNYGGNRQSYRMSGYQQYKMNSADAAFKLATILEENNFSPNINVNARKQGNCK